MLLNLWECGSVLQYFRRDAVYLGDTDKGTLLALLIILVYQSVQNDLAFFIYYANFTRYLKVSLSAGVVLGV